MGVLGGAGGGPISVVARELEQGEKDADDVGRRGEVELALVGAPVLLHRTLMDSDEKWKDKNRKNRKK